MREGELKVALRLRLGAVNAQWRVLTRETENTPKKIRKMEELRSQRLALMTALFEFERRDGQNCCAAARNGGSQMRGRLINPVRGSSNDNGGHHVGKVRAE